MKKPITRALSYIPTTELRIKEKGYFWRTAVIQRKFEVRGSISGKLFGYKWVKESDMPHVKESALDYIPVKVIHNIKVKFTKGE